MKMIRRVRELVRLASNPDALSDFHACNREALDQ
jgi:hypothetical protein